MHAHTREADKPDFVFVALILSISTEWNLSLTWKTGGKFNFWGIWWIFSSRLDSFYSAAFSKRCQISHLFNSKPFLFFPRSQYRQTVDSKSTNINTENFQHSVLSFSLTNIFTVITISIKGGLFFSYSALNCILTCSSHHFLLFFWYHSSHLICLSFFPKNTWNPFLCFAAFKWPTPNERLQAFLDHFQEKLNGELQAGESGIVPKTLNARLSTCIFKNDQKNKNKKKRKKLNSVQEFKMVVFSE